MKKCNHLSTKNGYYFCTIKNEILGDMCEYTGAYCEQCALHTSKCKYCGEFMAKPLKHRTCSNCFYKLKLIREIKARLQPIYDRREKRRNVHNLNEQNGGKM